MHKLLLGVLAATLALSTTAPAATPESGALTLDAKKTTWTGSITDPLGNYDLLMFFNGSTAVNGNETCTAPLCDTYTLTVPEGAQEIRLIAGSDQASNVSMDISAPDGSRWNLNDVDYLTERELIHEAVPGAWTVRVYGTSDLGFDYKATAEINLAGDPSFYPDEPVEEEAG